MRSIYSTLIDVEQDLHRSSGLMSQLGVKQCLLFLIDHFDYGVLQNQGREVYI